MTSKVASIISTLIVTLLLTNNVIAQSASEAAEYLDLISEHYEDIRKETWDYTSTMAHSRSARKVEKKRVALLKTIKSSIYSVKKLPAFNKDYSLRDSVVSYLRLNYKVLNEDYAEIIDLEAVAEQSYDLMEAYLLAQELAGDKLTEASEKLDVQYESFASKYNVNLIENTDKLSQKLKKSSEAFEYYNKVYLIFFKAYKQEVYILDAFSRNDLNAVEQNRNAMLSIVDEGLEKLKGISPHRGDNSLVTACKRLLLFFKNEAENDIPVMTDFLVTKEEYEKNLKLFQSKDRMQLTQDEVDQYNSSVNKYNKEINNYNNTNKNLNSKRNSNLEFWNDAVNKFMNAHIPRR